MKLSTFFSLLIFTFFSNYSVQSLFLGTIVYPSTTKTPDPLPLFFKGGWSWITTDKDSKISKKGTFEIYSERNCPELYLLITPHIQLPQSPDFEFLETDSEYRLVKLIRKSKMRETLTTSSSNQPSCLLEPIEYWDIQEFESLDEHGELIQRSIPRNTIILLTEPRLIVKIESEEWKCDDIYFKLPRVVFDSSIDQKQFHDMSTKMLFTAVDLGCLHKKITKTTKPFAQNRILSVRNPLSCYVDKI